MPNPPETKIKSALSPQIRSAQKKRATAAANEKLENRSCLSFRWCVFAGYGLLLLGALSIGPADATIGVQSIWENALPWGVLLLATGVVSLLISKRFMKRIDRLIGLTRQIARGDFTPISPISKYRDEFTTVNVALNHMLEELDTWHTGMEESHQMAAIGTLTAGVSHEINNPLNNIMLTAYTLEEEYADLSDEERREMIADLLQETERVHKIVRNLQDFAREGECVLKTLELGKLVEETILLVTNQVKASGAKININVQPHLPYIRGDQRQWKQVFINLILNALDASGKDGKINIHVEKDASPGFVAVHVENIGPVIPQHILPYIFNPFFTTKPPGKGTGLGLSVSQGIVTRHGGRIDVTTRDGKYTRFTVRIPSTDIAPEQCISRRETDQ
jgi:two-component system NtrC family sensor kinase